MRKEIALFPMLFVAFVTTQASCATRETGISTDAVKLEKTVGLPGDKYFVWELTPVKDDASPTGYKIPEDIEASSMLLDATLPRDFKSILMDAANESYKEARGNADIFRDLFLKKLSGLLAKKDRDGDSFIATFQTWLSKEWAFMGSPIRVYPTSKLNNYFYQHGVYTDEDIFMLMLTRYAVKIAGVNQSWDNLLQSAALQNAALRPPLYFASEACPIPLRFSWPSYWYLRVDQNPRYVSYATCPSDSSLWYYDSDNAWHLFSSNELNEFCHTARNAKESACNVHSKEVKGAGQ